MASEQAVQSLDLSNNDSASTPVQTVLERLEEDIVFGRLRPRERLIEEDLITRFSAKRHVVREALARLEQIGIVERRRNRGAVVKDLSPEEVEHIYAMRALLEGRAAELVPLPDPELAARLKAIHKRYEQAVDDSDLRSVFRLNIEFHQVLYSACGNPYLAEAIKVYANKTHGIRFYGIGNPVLLAQARQEHAAMIEAIRTGDRDTLIMLCVAHLRPAREAYTRAYKQIYT